MMVYQMNVDLDHCKDLFALICQNLIFKFCMPARSKSPVCFF